MPPDPETGKQRSQRIQIDYYRHKGGLDVLKWGCALIGLVGGGLYAIYVLAAGGGSHVSTGPVAVAHASFENDCYQCHTTLSPIAADAARPNLASFGLDKSASFQHTEAACQECHHAEHHYRNRMKDDWRVVDQNCAHCHSDHQGRDFDLTSVSQQKCVSCHANLSDVCAMTPLVKPDTSGFTKVEHGDFQSLMQDDPGLVKFDHHQHMMPGQVNRDDKGGITLELLDPDARERYRLSGQDDSALVTLDCSSCHQPAGNPSSTMSQAADQELGRHMKPIAFDDHCAACHSINPAGRTEGTLPLPHGAPWSEIELLLYAKILGMRATGKMRVPRDDSKSIPQPGFGAGAQMPPAPVVTSFDVAAQRRWLEQTCLTCHDVGSITDEGRNATSAPLIPTRWLRHGVFDHAAHSSVGCRYCHEQAFPSADSSRLPPTDHQVVMIAGIESCTGCHRDSQTSAPVSLFDDPSIPKKQPKWATDNCTLCHRYHLLPVSSGSSPHALPEAGQ